MSVIIDTIHANIQTTLVLWFRDYLIINKNFLFFPPIKIAKRFYILFIIDFNDLFRDEFFRIFTVL